jgi:hypothetical protein
LATPSRIVDQHRLVIIIGNAPESNLKVQAISSSAMVKGSNGYHAFYQM